jgi:hypothetical protein
VISSLERRSTGEFGASLEENESAHLFGSIRSEGMLDIGQAFADASWGILARFFLAGSERGRGTRPRALAGDCSAVEDEHHSFLQPAAVVEHGTALTAGVHRPATRLLAPNKIEREHIDAIAVTAAAPSSLPAPAEGSPLEGGGRVIRRLVHDPIFARHKFPSRAPGSFTRSRGAWT